MLRQPRVEIRGARLLGAQQQEVRKNPEPGTEASVERKPGNRGRIGNEAGRRWAHVLDDTCPAEVSR